MSDASAPRPVAEADDRMRKAAFWISAAVVSHMMWTSAAPALVYRLYAEQWHLSPAAITAIFAVYPIVVVAVLLLFGNLSDVVGRRAAMTLGISFSLAGVALFATSTGLGALFAGRALMGVGVGLSAGPATAALVDYSPVGRAGIAGPMNAAAQSFGMSASLIMGGALIQYAPYPTRTTFVLLAVLLAFLLVAMRRLPAPPAASTWARWRPSKPVVAASQRRPFLIAMASMTTAYTHGALLLSLGGHIVHDLIGSSNALVSGVMLAFFPLTLGLAGVLSRRLPPPTLVTWGAFGSLSGMALLALAVATRSIALMFVATAVSGAGYSFQVSGGLSTLTAASQLQTRGGLVSASLLVAYLAMGSSAVALGLAANRWGLAVAADIAAAAVATLSIVTWAIARFKNSSLPTPSSARSCDAVA